MQFPWLQLKGIIEIYNIAFDQILISLWLLLEPISCIVSMVFQEIHYMGKKVIWTCDKIYVEDLE